MIGTIRSGSSYSLPSIGQVQRRSGAAQVTRALGLRDLKLPRKVVSSEPQALLERGWPALRFPPMKPDLRHDTPLRYIQTNNMQARLASRAFGQGMPGGTCNTFANLYFK